MPERDLFPPGTEQAFDLYLYQLNNEKRYQFEHVKRAEYRHWLLYQESPVRGETQQERQQKYNQKNRALSNFELRNGQLLRSATPEEPAKYVVCTY
jgi:hypothetical protein